MAERLPPKYGATWKGPEAQSKNFFGHVFDSLLWCNKAMLIFPLLGNGAGTWAPYPMKIDWLFLVKDCEAFIAKVGVLTCPNLVRLHTSTYHTPTKTCTGTQHSS